GVHLQAPLADREAAGPDEPTGASGPGDDAELPAGVEDLAGLRRPAGDALRGGSERGAGLGPAGGFAWESGGPGGGRGCGGDRDALGGEVRQDDRLPQEPGLRSSADEQPRRAGQPQAEAPGEGPVQVAEAAADRRVPGAPPGSVVGSGAGDPKRWAGGGGW